MIKQQAIFMALLILALPAGADVIVLTDGTRFTNVRVTSESLAEVKYTTSSGTARSVTPGAKVRLILRDDLPEGYENGQRYLRSGDYRAAISEFQSVASAAGGKSWLAEYSYFKLAEAYRLQGIRRKDSGSLSDAVGAYNKVIEQNGQSRFLFVAHLRRGVCFRIMKQYGKATNAYEAAGAAAGAHSLGDAFTKRASLGAAWTKLESGDHAGAKSAFEACASGTSADSGLHRQAMSGWCEAAVAGGDAAAVKAKMEGLLGSANTREQKAMVHNGLGVALFGEKKYAEARLHFVQTIAINFSDPDEHARALYYAGRCYAALKQKGDYQMLYWKELKSRYPASTWSVRAGS